MRTIESHMREVYREIQQVCPSLYSLNISLTEYQPDGLPPGVAIWLHEKPNTTLFRSTKDLCSFIEKKQAKRIKDEILYRKFAPITEN